MTRALYYCRFANIAWATLLWVSRPMTPQINSPASTSLSKSMPVDIPSPFLWIGERIYGWSVGHTTRNKHVLYSNSHHIYNLLGCDISRSSFGVGTLKQKTQWSGPISHVPLAFYASTTYPTQSSNRRINDSDSSFYCRDNVGQCHSIGIVKMSRQLFHRSYGLG